MYQVGLIRVSMCVSIFSQFILGYSDICIFYIEILDKEDLEIFCQDIIVLVGVSCDYFLMLDCFDVGMIDNCIIGFGIIMLFISFDNQNYVDEIEFGFDDFINSLVMVYL